MVPSRGVLSTLPATALRVLVVVSAFCAFFGTTGLGAALLGTALFDSCGAACPCEHTTENGEAHTTVSDGAAVYGVVDRAAVDRAAVDRAVSVSTHDRSHGNSLEHDRGAYDCGEHDCGEDCPNCGCCLTLAATIVTPVYLGSKPGSSTNGRVLAPQNVPGSGEFTGVFRPPRSLT